MNDKMSMGRVGSEQLQDVFRRMWEMTGQEGSYEDFMRSHVARSEEDRVRQNAESYNRTAGTLNEIDGYNCKKCNNRGDWLTVREHNGHWIETVQRCTCWKARTAIRRLRRSGLENSLRKFSEFEATEDWQKNMLEVAMAYLIADKSNGETLYLGGQVGCGKTFIGSAVCRELLHAGHEVIYMPWVTESRRLRALANDESFDDEISLYSKAEFLYIDDLFKPVPGNSGPTGPEVRLAYDIFNYRYVNKLPMIISCEMYMPELVKLDEATLTRVYERAKKFTVNIKREYGRNYRTKGADLLI